ncbi:MAG: PHP domain-containing protein [Bacteroidia bacterium]|nr:PHP domain-containing protein [Bacteroidia bacterium]
MKNFKADLHIHTCLSPCGDLDMSPRNIVRTAIEKGLDIIAITDHNSTRNVKTCVEIGEKHGLFVIPGCEVNTQEEVHCLCYFPDLETLNEFQRYLDEKMPDIKNDVELFGYQVAVDENDVIVYEEERSLYTGIQDDIEGVQQKVHSLGGIFVPAHIDRMKNGVYGQLGFIPFDLQYDALEISRRILPEDFLREHPEIASKKILRSSDAHFLNHIASVHTDFYMGGLNWENFKSQIVNCNG